MEAAAAASPGSSSLEAVATAFRSRVNELQDLALARNSELSLLAQPAPRTLGSGPPSAVGPDPSSSPYAVYPATAVTDLTAVDTSVTGMEAQVQAIRRRLQEELDAIPKAKVSLPVLVIYWVAICF